MEFHHPEIMTPRAKGAGQTCKDVPTVWSLLDGRGTVSIASPVSFLPNDLTN